jgi:hypothetical protein
VADRLDEPALGGHLAAGTTFEDFFAEARVNPHATLIRVWCAACASRIADRLMRQIRYLDKLVDDLAKDKPMDRILRAQRSVCHPRGAAQLGVSIAADAPAA